jgi:2-polyprenyl-6-methoxyphenol hydroxylase-like FAD-dependent oxidoreductase
MRFVFEVMPTGEIGADYPLEHRLAASLAFTGFSLEPVAERMVTLTDTRRRSKIRPAAEAMSMPVNDYDLIAVGGGLGGAALAKTMAEAGARVLVLEQEAKFKDRVRGEFLAPWGVAEARLLFIEDLLQSCGCYVPKVEMGMGAPRDLTATTPQGLPALGFSHPQMQEALLEAASKAGAEIRRGTTVTDIQPGKPPRVQFHASSGSEKVSARLVVAADGRSSAARKWAGFELKRQSHPFLFAGVLLSGLAMPQDLGHYCFNPGIAMVNAVVYQGKDRFRAYLGYPSDGIERLQGEQTLPRFLDESRRTTASPSFYEGDLRCIGPLASFSCDEDWVEHPYSDGVALIGDAAATSDPIFGQGMSLTLRDVRALSDKLLSSNNWESASNDYATSHRRYFSVIHTSCEWLRHVFQEQSPEADRTRAVAMPLIAEDPTRIPDHIMSGPELPIDDGVRARFFGEQTKAA